MSTVQAQSLYLDIKPLRKGQGNCSEEIVTNHAPRSTLLHIILMPYMVTSLAHTERDAYNDPL